MKTQDTELDRAMAVLAAEHRAARIPAGVEQAVVAAFEASRRRRRFGIAGAGAAIAAMLVAGALLVRERPVRHPPAIAAAVGERAAPPVIESRKVAVTKAPLRKPPVRQREPVRQSVPRETAEEPFVAIPYTVPLAPEERATVVRITLSPSAIAAVGFPLPAIDPGRETLADVLVGEDGRAHAIRIVADSSFR